MLVLWRAASAVTSPDHEAGNVLAVDRGRFSRCGTPRAARRRWSALGCALVSLAAAVVGALGPAESVRTAYSWPPQDFPAEPASRLSYTPLLLARHQPASISATIPCLAAASDEPLDQPMTILATARTPEATGGLSVARVGDHLVLEVGGRTLAEVDLPARAPTDETCAFQVAVADGTWSVRGGPQRESLRGTTDMPVVSGFFSDLDLRARAAPEIAVTTSVHDSRATARQTVAWVVAVVALAIAFLLAFLADARRPGPARRGLRSRLGRVARRLHLADVVVVAVLSLWWIVAPVVWDDGWVVARERAFAASGGFSTYYDVFGVNLPLDYWPEWLHHWIAERTTVVLDLRLHALVALVATWLLLRWAFGRVRGPALSRFDSSLWALASAFLVVALGWDMAIRPEPVTALLATAAAACAVRFAAGEAIGPLIAMALVVPLALTAHHTGLVALAPVLAVAPPMLRWARGRVLALATLVVGAVSWAVVLAFVGSDVGHRLSDARATSESGITSSWRDEPTRYVLVDGFPWATPLRRATVVLIGFALLAFVTRRRSGGRLLDLPAVMLAVALVLFVLTPSKVAWHFGALAGLVALAVGSEVARIRDEGARSRGWQLRPYLIVGAVIAAAAWSWFPRDAWNPVDLRSLTWDPGVGRHDSVLQARDRVAGDRPRVRDARGSQARSSLRGCRNPVAGCGLDRADARGPADRLHDRRARP